MDNNKFENENVNNTDLSQSNKDKENLLNKEKILAKSREENKNGDERESQVTKNASNLMLIVMACLTVIIYIVEFAVNKVWRMDLLAICNSVMAVGSIYLAARIKKKLHIVCSIVFSLLAIGYFIGRIIQLCGA